MNPSWYPDDDLIKNSNIHGLANGKKSFIRICAIAVDKAVDM